MSIEQQIGYCRTADGVRIAYATYGNDDAPPLVYIPDVPGQEAIWASPWGRAFMEELGRHRRLITVEPAGFGASQRDVRVATSGLAKDLSAMVDHLRLQTFEAFATGMGPVIATTEFAVARPGQMSKLVMFNPRLSSSAADVFVAESVRAAFSLYCRSAGTVYFPSGPVEAQRWFSRAIPEFCSAENLEAFLRGKFDLTKTLPELRLPVLIVHRTKSQAVRAAEVKMAASLIPDAKLVTLGGDAGAEYWEFEQYLGALYDFLGISRDLTPQPPLRDSGGLHRVERGSTSAVILFTDIVSSTELTETMGDARFRDASRALDVGLRAAIRDAGGVAVEGKLLGDGVLATFGSAAQAIDGAQRCLALSAASELGLHIGLHAGDVIREEVEGRRDVFGGAVNIAARICGLSAPGEILVSDVVRGMARSSAGVVFEDRGEREMKGVGEAVRVYAVLAHGVGDR